MCISLISGCVVLLALAFLMPTFYFIPKTILGAVIITAVYPMIEYHEILPMWRGRSKDKFTNDNNRLDIQTKQKSCIWNFVLFRN